MNSDQWKSVTGGKTKSPFLQTFDKKYVMKCVHKKELKMFLEFAPQYFDYLCKSLFHEYPCTLAKIVGIYKI
jgi:1-phosphatidylinositol-3-phosphate 5-kinase